VAVAYRATVIRTIDVEAGKIQVFGRPDNRLVCIQRQKIPRNDPCPEGCWGESKHQSPDVWMQQKIQSRPGLHIYIPAAAECREVGRKEKESVNQRIVTFILHFRISDIFENPVSGNHRP
jgi:hypothetical protein